MTKPTCEKCGRRNLVTYQVEPNDAWHAVMRDRWKSIGPSCFDAEAELTDVRYQFIWYASDILERPGRVGQEVTSASVAMPAQRRY